MISMTQSSHKARLFQKALQALITLDGDIARTYANYGAPKDRFLPEGFETLAKIIIGQQISRRAASHIWQRLVEADLTSSVPIANATDGDLRHCGLSVRKAGYLRDIAQNILNGSLPIEEFSQLPVAEVTAHLLRQKGVGPWTADNYTLFALGDMNAWPSNDIALQEGMKRLKSLDQRPSQQEMDEIAAGWHPYRGAGALFLWHIYAIEVRKAAPSDI